jgi:hypothetical protein
VSGKVTPSDFGNQGMHVRAMSSRLKMHEYLFKIHAKFASKALTVKQLSCKQKNRIRVPVLAQYEKNNNIA